MPLGAALCRCSRLQDRIVAVTISPSSSAQPARIRARRTQAPKTLNRFFVGHKGFIVFDFALR